MRNSLAAAAMALFVCFTALSTAATAAGLGDVVDKTGAVPPTPKVDAQTPPAQTPGARGEAEGFQGGNADLHDRVAQLMLVTMEGSFAPTSADRDLLAKYTPGGVVAPMLIRPSSVAGYMKDIQAFATSKGIKLPLLAGADLYDHSHYDKRMQNRFVQLPTPLSVAAAHDDKVTEEYAKLVAEEADMLGFNFMFGPALSLAPEIDKARGNLYCFGNDPEFISDTAEKIYDLMKEKKIVAMPMDFPGGASNRRQGTAAVLLTPGAEMPDKDLMPFMRLLNKDLPMLHVGTTLVPMLDTASIPACVSPRVIQGILREHFAYKGIIVAGPMDSSDVAERMDPSDAAMQAIAAGADLIYWRKPGPRVMKTVDQIVRAVETGALPESIINAATERVASYRAELLKREAKKRVEEKAGKLETRRKYPNISYGIERRAITLVQNRNNVLPLTRKGSTPVGIVGPVGADDLYELLTKALKEKNLGRYNIATADHTGDIQDFEIDRIKMHFKGGRTMICVFPQSSRPASCAVLISELKKMGYNVVVVLLGYPSALPEFAQADAIVVAYCEPEQCDQSLRAVAELLIGKSAIRILPPNRDLEVTAGVETEFNVYEVARTPAGRLPVTVSEAFPADLSIPYSVRDVIKRVWWDFGDGKKAKNPIVKHLYELPGRYPLTLRIKDNSGQETTGTFHVVVK